MVGTLNSDKVTPILHQVQISLVVVKNVVTLVFRWFSFQDRRNPKKTENPQIIGRTPPPPKKKNQMIFSIFLFLEEKLSYRAAAVAAAS